MSNQEQLMTQDQDHHLAMGEALDRLRKNPDFQKVVMEGYCQEKAMASVSLLAVPQISQQPGGRGGVMEDLVSISNLQYFFNMIDQFHEGAKDPVLSDDEESQMEGDQ